MKKVVGLCKSFLFFCVLVMVMFLFTGGKIKAAADYKGDPNLYHYNYYIGNGNYKKWKLSFTYNYYRFHTYRDANLVRLYQNNITKTAYYDHLAATHIVEYAKQYTTSATTTIAMSTKYSLSFCEQLDKVLSMTAGMEQTFSQTLSMTFTKSEMYGYKYTLDRNSPVGYYAMCLGFDSYIYQTVLERSQDGQKTWQHYSTDYYFKFTTERPYIYLRYSTTAF